MKQYIISEELLDRMKSALNKKSHEESGFIHELNELSNTISMELSLADVKADLDELISEAEWERDKEIDEIFLHLNYLKEVEQGTPCICSNKKQECNCYKEE